MAYYKLVPNALGRLVREVKEAKEERGILLVMPQPKRPRRRVRRAPCKVLRFTVN